MHSLFQTTKENHIKEMSTTNIIIKDASRNFNKVTYKSGNSITVDQTNKMINRVINHDLRIDMKRVGLKREDLKTIA